MTDQDSSDQRRHAAEDFARVASLIRKYTNDNASLRAIMSNNMNIILAALEEPVAPDFIEKSARAAIKALRGLEQTAIMLETYAPEVFPEVNEAGQVHFGRAMMESAAEAIRQAWADAIAEVSPEISKHPLDGLLEPGASKFDTQTSVAISLKRIADAITNPDPYHNPITSAIANGIGNGALEWTSHMARSGR